MRSPLKIYWTFSMNELMCVFVYMFQGQQIFKIAFLIIIILHTLESYFAQNLPFFISDHFVCFSRVLKATVIWCNIYNLLQLFWNVKAVERSEWGMNYSAAVPEQSSSWENLLQLNTNHVLYVCTMKRYWTTSVSKLTFYQISLW
jgi:hypothetical protein